jgi:hypothetical protein
MGIKDDLAKAREAVNDIITWDDVIKLLCEKHQVSKIEIARWLTLKQVHLYIDSYLLNPTIPMVEKSSGDLAANYLAKITNPSWMDSFAHIQNAGQRVTKREAVNLNKLNSFLESQGIGILGSESETTIKENPDNETQPQKRIRMIVEALTGDEGYADKLALPTSAKGKLKAELLKKHPQIFTNSTFDKAWSDASASGIIGIAEKEKYMPRK